MSTFANEPRPPTSDEMRDYLLSMLDSLRKLALDHQSPEPAEEAASLHGASSGSVLPFRRQDSAEKLVVRDSKRQFQSNKGACLGDMTAALRELALRYGHTDIVESLTSIDASQAAMSMSHTDALLARPFGAIEDLVRHHAISTPERVAIVGSDQASDGVQLTYRELDNLAGRVAAALRRDGVAAGEVIAVCTALTADYVALLIGALRAGVVVAPLANWLDPDAFRAVLADAAPKILFADAASLAEAPSQGVRGIMLDRRGLEVWIGHRPLEVPPPVQVGPETINLLLYSSGTTGVPKAVAQRRATAWAVKNNLGVGRGVMLIATPSYLASSIVAMLAPLFTGGTVVLMKKFDARRYLELAQTYRATHTSLVPIQYRRILAVPDFDAFDLSAFKLKISTGAALAPALKAEILRRWPGLFWEIYSMSEGSCSFRLEANKHPDKLHTVGRPSPGCVIKIIDDNGIEVAAGLIGEIVGRSAIMMAGYHANPAATAEAEWFDANRLRFIRTGDLGYLDEDGFLILVGRKRDMIISGGLKIHAADIERIIEQHPDVDEAAVVAAPSERWGETPVAFVVCRSGCNPETDQLRDWINGQVNKIQSLAEVIVIDVLPRNPGGKVLKRALRDRLSGYV